MPDLCGVALENSENELNDITYFIEYYLRVMELQLERSMAFKVTV